MWQGRRSDLLLGGLALVAVSNGLLLGLSLYGLLAAALGVVHGKAPALGYAWLAGALTGVSLLLVALRRERTLQEGEHSVWTPFADNPEGNPTVQRFRALVSRTSLDQPPTLGWVDSPDLNAFAVGRSRDEASIILTSALIERLQPEELDAVVAQQLAHVESDDLKAVGLADAIADSIGDFAQAKGRVFWGPQAIVTETRPFLLVIAGFVLIAALPQFGANDDDLTFLFGILSLILLYALWQAAKRSWRGLIQLFLLISFFGPLSLVEAALAPPTAVALSRLVSRSRVHEADARAVELVGKEPLISVLIGLESVERSQASSPRLGGRRFSLFVTQRPQAGYQAWLAHLYATHPSISSRLETIRALD